MTKVPVRGCDSRGDIERSLYAQHGKVNVVWEENLTYVGPMSLTDKRGFEEVRGWYVVKGKDGDESKG